MISAGKTTAQCVQEFKDTFLERLERAYSDEIFNIFNDMPKSVVRFNNTESLKKAQMYVRHTNRIFSKQFSVLIASLFQLNGDFASTAKDSKGDCVFNKSKHTRFHFLSLEQVAGFPHVPWYNPSLGNNTSPNSVNDVYVIMVKMDASGKSLLDNLCSNPICPSYVFTSLEGFLIQSFGQDCWNNMLEAFSEIEYRSSQYQWFELAKTCNESTLQEFRKNTGMLLTGIHYENLSSALDLQLDHSSRTILDWNYISKRRYTLMLGDKDFAKSFCTSEWLYGQKYRDDLLDKTYIITGYIKSVEQLLSYIIQSQSGEYKISVMNKGEFKEVPANSEESLSATLGNMVHFLKAFENQSIFMEGLTSYYIRKVSFIIQDWIKYERNGYFHKHNISSMDRVAEIRDSTLLIYYLLLGSIKTLS